MSLVPMAADSLWALMMILATSSLVLYGSRQPVGADDDPGDLELPHRHDPRLPQVRLTIPGGCDRRVPASLRPCIRLQRFTRVTHQHRGPVLWSCGSRRVSCLFFFLMILLGCFFLLNVILAIVVR